jgi:hypothetical protein
MRRYRGGLEYVEDNGNFEVWKLGVEFGCIYLEGEFTSQLKQI